MKLDTFFEMHTRLSLSFCALSLAPFFVCHLKMRFTQQQQQQQRLLPHALSLHKNCIALRTGSSVLSFCWQFVAAAVAAVVFRTNKRCLAKLFSILD
jgi:hypothetical protein